MFEQIIGNAKIKEYLSTSISTNSVSHSYMFVGKSGVGKKIIAREFAENIMNANSEKKVVNLDSTTDYMQIDPEGNTIKIAQIRELQTKIFEKPTSFSKKIYLINDADLMTEESQNCLLKTLEEPPEYAIIILIVSNESKMLETIKSRCVIVKFNNLSDNEISDYLKMTNNTKLNNIPEITKLLEGSLEKIEEIEYKKEEYETLKKIAENIKTGNILNVISNADLLYTSKDDIIELLEYMNIIFFNARKLSAIDIIENTKRKLLANNNYEMCIDNMLMQLCKSMHNK